MTHKENGLLIKLLIFIVLFVSFLLLPVFAGEYRLVTLNKSNHFNTDKQYNETHGGIGLEYGLSDDVWFGVVSYTNSFNEESILLSFNKEYKTIVPNLYLGLIGGAASGYDPYLFVSGITIRYSIIRVILLPTVGVVGIVWKF